jgi:hypothetical protein
MINDPSFIGGEVQRVEAKLLDFTATRQYQDFTIELPSTALTPFDVPHQLTVSNPDKIRWEVLQSSNPVLVFRHPEDTLGAQFMRLRATADGGQIRLRLSVDDGNAFEPLPPTNYGMTVPASVYGIKIGAGDLPEGSEASVIQFNGPGSSSGLQTNRSFGFAHRLGGASVGSELSFVDFNSVASYGQIIRWRYQPTTPAYEFGPHHSGRTAFQGAVSGGKVTLGSDLDSSKGGYWDNLFSLLVTTEGVKFPSTQVASSNANTLDDYEEGTFTPIITSAGGGTPTYSVQSGFYLKIGQLVWVHARCILSNKGTLAAGQIRFAGLPFTVSGAATTMGGFSVNYFGGMTTNIINLMAFADGATTQGDFYYTAAAAAAATVLTVADVGNGFDVMYSGCYRATA